MGNELSTEEWKTEKKRKRAQMTAMQALPYKVKVKRAELRAKEYIERLDDMGLQAHVSVGGLDSIVLLLFLRHIGIDVPAISVSSLEDKSIQEVHRTSRRPSGLRRQLHHTTHWLTKIQS